MNILNNFNDLIHSWQVSPYPSTKLSSYFSAYSDLFGHLRGSDCVFVETGVLLGGSLFMWRNWLGENARIIGIDLNPDALKWRDHGFEIYIGDQGDPNFWDILLKEIGQIDGFLDDGGHQSFQQIATLEALLKHLNGKSVIAIEDTHASLMRDFNSHGQHSFLNYAKAATDFLTMRIRDSYPNRMPDLKNLIVDDLLSNVYSIQFFGSLVAFQVDPFIAKPPKLLWNMRPSNIRDFRYDGVSHVNVTWPDPFRIELVRIDGENK